MIAWDFPILMHALAPLDTRESLEQPSPAAISAATGRTATQVTAQKEINQEAQDCSASITHIDGGEPRAGINLVTVFGERVQCLVSYEGRGEYIAQEVDFDLGRPTCCAHSPLQALRDLQSLLEDEHIRDARRRDADFAATVARAAP